MRANSIRVEIRDDNSVLREYVDNIVTKAEWEWLRIGGCGNGNITVADEFDDLAARIGEDYEVRIYLPGSDGIPVLWYSGFIDRISPSVESGGEKVDISFMGYVNYLKRIVVRDRIYSGNELSAIAKDVIDTFVAPNSKITSTAANYEDSGFTADTLYFNESAHDVIKKLADIAGKMEWGVNADKEFFFKQRSEVVKRYFHVKERISSFNPVKDFGEIVTGMYLDGGEGYSGHFWVTNRKTNKEEIVSNSSIITQSVGQQFARMYLKKRASPKKRYAGSIPNFNARVEGTVPLGRAAVNLRIGIDNKYDSGITYDSGAKYDGGTEKFQIEKVKYMLTSHGVDVKIEFGDAQKDISDELGRLEYLITNEGNI